MVGRPAKKDVHVLLDKSNYEWAVIHGFDFTGRFDDFLSMVRRETEIVSYGLIIGRRPTTESQRRDGQRSVGYRKALISLLGGKCQDCGTTEDLLVHHIDGNPENAELTNLRLVCGRCHGKYPRGAHGV
ncbi:HNH endonuclease [Candidatus Bathyarchaeota archaeon]|nr:HNH endonuclease [Candidatus Bathyarchaeota archaeon]